MRANENATLHINISSPFNINRCNNQTAMISKVSLPGIMFTDVIYKNSQIFEHKMLDKTYFVS